MFRLRFALPSLIKASSTLACLSSAFFGDAMALEELILDVPAEEAQTVIERNEMRYEEHRWHSFPDRIRIAKIDVDLLQQPDSTISITPFADVPPIVVKSIGAEGPKWIAKKTQGIIPEDALRSELGKQAPPEAIDAIIQLHNRVELNITRVFKDRRTGKYSPVPAAYKIVASREEIGDVMTNVPVLREEDVEIVTQVYGTVNTFDDPTSPGRPRSYTIKLLENDADYVMVYEWDNAKNHHHMEPPADPEAWAKSERGQKYERLRKEKEAYLARVAERISEREKN